jgi:hypothetical protein
MIGGSTTGSSTRRSPCDVRSPAMRSWANVDYILRGLKNSSAGRKLKVVRVIGDVLGAGAQRFEPWSVEFVPGGRAPGGG